MIGSISGGQPPHDDEKDKPVEKKPEEKQPAEQQLPDDEKKAAPHSPRTNRRYGWRPQPPSPKDWKFKPRIEKEKLSVFKNLHSLCKTVFDQLQEGSCVSNGVVDMMMMCMTIQKKAQVTLSRNFLYYNARLIEGTAAIDAGLIPRDAFASAATTGVVTEDLWPYNVQTLYTPPPASLYALSGKHRITSYLAVSQDLTSMLQCIEEGYPFGFGFSVFESFESEAVATSGNAPMPSPGNDPFVGGHFVVAIGQNQGPDRRFEDGTIWPSRTFLCQHSWGPNWGMRSMAGCFTIPFDYVISPALASDIWTIRADT